MQGKAEENIPAFLERCGASILVMDFSPLRIGKVWREGVCRRAPSSVSVFEVDAHNVVPAWVASEKLEYSARTIRSKIQKKLAEYLVEYPSLVVPSKTWTLEKPEAIDWDFLIEDINK